MLCSCPSAEALTEIKTVYCPEGFGQIQKAAFQRLRDGDGNRNSFTATNAIETLASWTAKMSATDSTKIVISPYLQAPTSEPGAARTFGGGNETPSGIETIIGREPTTFSAVLRNIPQSIIKALKKLECEAQGGNIGVYLFDENGRIEAIKDETVATTFYPIPIRSLFFSDKGHGGLEAPDSNNVSWSFEPNYSDNLAIITPSFNPLSDLIVE